MSKESRLRRRAILAAQEAEHASREAQARARADRQRELQNLQVTAAKLLKQHLKYRTRPQDWQIGTKTDTLGSDDYGYTTHTSYYAETTIEGITVRYYEHDRLLRIVSAHGDRVGLSPRSFGEELQRRGAR